MNETIFINPGAICKANTPGTYAEIAIYYGTQIPVIIYYYNINN